MPTIVVICILGMWLLSIAAREWALFLLMSAAIIICAGFPILGLMLGFIPFMYVVSRSQDIEKEKHKQLIRDVLNEKDKENK